MNMKRISLGAMALGLGIMMMASCGSKGVKSVQAEAESQAAETATEWLSFDSILVDTATTIVSGKDTLRGTVHIQLMLAKGPGADAVNDSILQSGIFMPEYMPQDTKGMTAAQQVHAYAKNFLAGYLADVNGMKKQGVELFPTFSYSYELTSQVDQNQQDSLANYLVSGYVYMGGAHGSSISVARNFDIHTGKQLDKQGLLRPEGEKPVTDMVYQGIVKSLGSEAANLKDMLFFGEKPYLTGNFLVQPDTITFIYQTDEIAPHACGEFRIPLSKKSLQQYLK